MPFTPFHMGPGIVIKSVLQGGFSLMVFGWAQIIMDIQPLIALTTGKGSVHGFSHTYIGSTLLALFAALTGKRLSEWALDIVALGIGKEKQIKISWSITLLSAFIGSYSHVLLDSMMHADMKPFFPFSDNNVLLGIVSRWAVYKWCFYSALVGSGLYFGVRYIIGHRRGSRR